MVAVMLAYITFLARGGGCTIGFAEHEVRAIASGADLLRDRIDTPFGQHQAILRDPEGNVFRLSAAVGS
jgi:uncharacterized glyoxalase superfamily protein PhnB